VSETAIAILELVDRGEWRSITAEEHALIRQWMLGATVFDLYLLLLEAKRRWRRARRSSSATLQAIADHAAPLSEPPRGTDDE
jgi:hypothetical protein